MYKNLIYLLKKIKYEVRHLKPKKNTLINSDRNFVQKDYLTLKTFVTNYKNLHIDNPKLFGKNVDLSDTSIFSIDIFNKFKFPDKRLKPAYFNKADVKVPYELSRLQFLQKNYHSDLDVDNFPLIFWNSPMDVAIRNINLNFHFIKTQFFTEDEYKDPIFDRQFDKHIQYIEKHYNFVINNLEDSGNVVGNHYFIELVAVLMNISMFDFKNRDIDLKKYIKLFEQELSNQFNDEGTNFEGSTHYSALMLESLILAKLSIQSLDLQNKSLLSKLDYLIKENRNFLSLFVIEEELSQIGDNDSGRIFYQEYDESNPLKLNWLLDLVDVLYDKEENNTNNAKKNFANSDQIQINLSKFHRVQHPKIKIFSKDFDVFGYLEFGVVVWRNDKEYLSVRCGPLGQNGIGGHSHYDQLSIECFDGETWIARDPGTGTYTDNIKLRNKFRSFKYHWGPNLNINEIKNDEFECFKLSNISDGVLLNFDKNSFLGKVNFLGHDIYRKINITQDGFVEIEDFCMEPILSEYNSWGEESFGIKHEFSNGYKRVK